MDLIGLRSDLLEQLNRDWHVHRQLEASDERKARDKSLENTIAILKKIAGASDISLILITEKLLLNQELSLYANSPEEHNSIKTALGQLEDAERSLRIVHNPEAYRNATNTYPSKRKENGLPLDSFREFIKSHSTRLTNRLAGRLAIPEKEILRQRKVNLEIILSKYISLQQKTLIDD